MPKPTYPAKPESNADDAESGSARAKAGIGKSRRGRLAAGAALGALTLTSGIAGIFDVTPPTTANGPGVNVGRLAITLATYGGYKLDSCTSNTNDTSTSSVTGGSSSNSNDTTASTQESTSSTSTSGGGNEPPADTQTNLIPGDNQLAAPQVTSGTGTAGGQDEDYYFSSSESDDDSSGTNTIAQWQANNNEYRPDDPNSEEQSDLDYAAAYAAGDPYHADN
ncbi:hypothetical protein [Mycobacterium gastri]|uniref:Uncharacterized protein n=1 Tax=Mycobacterium gastri TaxID=1777 RepID=A0A1X1VHF1_MYCGS|nr:hypothetical protein [Mycobacterium gastri]ETW24274.1 hypothetical protein MGAST_09360 [Mycobacterium gastri 'Wayne']ORV68471.1 hypothetical protein AWC07_08260 [Mycobacterium gastri]